MSPVLFDEAQAGEVNIASTWRQRRLLADYAIQTEVINSDDAETQTCEREDAQVQTDTNTSDAHGEADEGELSDFLCKVTPLMETQLKLNARSRAFDDYDVNWEQARGEIRCLHVLAPAPTEPSAAVPAGQRSPGSPTIENEEDGLRDDQKVLFPVTAVSWNCTGWAIAVTYGRFDHAGTCPHRTSLRTWNIGRRTVNPSKPDIAVEAPCCLMSVAYHPQQPSIVAAGSFNGEIFVWDLSRTEDPLIATSAVSDSSHREAVVEIQWLYDIRDRSYNQFMSLSTDGRVLVWSRRHNYKHPVAGFHLVPSGAVKGRAKSGLVHGGTALSVSKLEPSTFLVGTENGGMYKCFLNAKLLAPPTKDKEVPKITFTSPINFAYEPHAGPVHAVHCSPFHRSLIVSCSSDSTLRVYDLLQMKPVMVLGPSPAYLYSLQWSPSRPLVFAVGAGTGAVHLYDLMNNNLAPVLRLQVNDRHVPVFALAFNEMMPEYLATGDGTGTVKIWQLSSALANSVAPRREMEGLSRLSTSSAGRPVTVL